MADSDFPHKAIRIFSFILIILALAIYIGWGVAYGSWNIFSAEYIPIYSIMIILILLGICGLLLTKTKSKSE
ncbi:hypothetical protein [Candidatus Methanomassiliicoccus intestinalis]|uniref:Uncharacterized protein n=1 Tax=Methanomassiliicoccus intestinalis (strain Issoire-Mx1) TaxID=1295009 RepID=R9TCD4_METII|nr:hypothetical protein [Candidatus Methanomassiliicoccus intestinalis]AGN27128.1 hypothetical protein MMINT_18510 [Candidatus Methanomassiliicoccus intestinalis Issoire-Mx1]